MDKIIRYEQCPECNGWVYSEKPEFIGDYFKMQVTCERCEKTWVEIYTFSHNEEEN